LGAQRRNLDGGRYPYVIEREVTVNGGQLPNGDAAAVYEEERLTSLNRQPSELILVAVEV
jgi:redox-sensitive bicupin YhaK (pirin superfamily)